MYITVVLGSILGGIAAGGAAATSSLFIWTCNLYIGEVSLMSSSSSSSSSMMMRTTEGKQTYVAMTQNNSQAYKWYTGGV